MKGSTAQSWIEAMKEFIRRHGHPPTQVELDSVTEEEIYLLGADIVGD